MEPIVEEDGATPPRSRDGWEQEDTSFHQQQQSSPLNRSGENLFNQYSINPVPNVPHRRNVGEGEVLRLVLARLLHQRRTTIVLVRMMLLSVLLRHRTMMIPTSLLASGRVQRMIDGTIQGRISRKTSTRRPQLLRLLQLLERTLSRQHLLLESPRLVPPIVN